MTKKYLNRVKAWDLFALWENGDREVLHDIPQKLIVDINNYLDKLEEERAKDENRE